MITTNLKTTARRWFDLPVPATAAIAVFLLVLLGGVVGRLHSMPSAAVAAPTPALPVIVIATPVAAPAPPAAAVVARLAPNTLRHAAVAYGAPDLASAIGALEAGRTYQLLARYGADWLQANVTGSGVVWLRASDVLDLPAGLADLQPPPTPAVVERPVYVVAQPAPVEQAAPTVSEPSAPVATLTLQTAAILDRQQWAMDAQAAGR